MPEWTRMFFLGVLLLLLFPRHIARAGDDASRRQKAATLLDESIKLFRQAQRENAEYHEEQNLLAKRLFGEALLKMREAEAELRKAGVDTREDAPAPEAKAAPESKAAPTGENCARLQE